MAFTIVHRFTRRALMNDAARRELLVAWTEAHAEDFRGIGLPSKRPSKGEVDQLAKAQGRVVELERRVEEDNKYQLELEREVKSVKTQLEAAERKREDDRKHIEKLEKKLEAAK